MKVAIFILATVISTACAENKKHDVYVAGSVEKVLQKAPDDALVTACENWNIDSNAIKTVFTLSDEYTEYPYSQFYQTPCDITGDLVINGLKWHFSLNGGGIMTLSREDKTMYRGCSDTQCAPYILLLTDDMSGN